MARRPRDPLLSLVLWSLFVAVIIAGGILVLAGMFGGYPH